MLLLDCHLDLGIKIIKWESLLTLCWVYMDHIFYIVLHYDFDWKKKKKNIYKYPSYIKKSHKKLKLMKGIIRGWVGPYLREVAPEPASLPLKGGGVAGSARGHLDWNLNRNPRTASLHPGPTARNRVHCPSGYAAWSRAGKQAVLELWRLNVVPQPTCLCACVRLQNFFPLPHNGSQKRRKDTQGLLNMVDISIHWLKSRTFCHSWV